MSATNPTTTVSNEVARRFLLGRQGLWPGHRWRGKSGTLAAVRTLGSVQMDPLTIVARSHDLVLWSRVINYRPEDLHDLLYTDRTLFDYGGVLRIQPIEELPHWRLHMERRREDRKYYTPLVTTHSKLFEMVRAIVDHEGPLPARAIVKFISQAAIPRNPASMGGTGSYRSQSVVNKVAYQLWMTGELMTHHRQGFERHYDRADRVAPADLLLASDETTAKAFFAQRILEKQGLITLGAWRSAMAYALNRKIDRTEATEWTEQLIAGGEAITVAVDGQRGRFLAPKDAASQLHDLLDGGVPADWKPARSSGNVEAFLLSPLDPIVARERAKALFGFEHVWEIYKPAEKRRWGPFTMPILYGDALVGRVDPRMDRETGTLHLNGIWLDTADFAADSTFASVLTGRIQALAEFLGADQIELHACEPAALSRRLPFGFDP